MPCSLFVPRAFGAPTLNGRPWPKGDPVPLRIAHWQSATHPRPLGTVLDRHGMVEKVIIPRPQERVSSTRPLAVLQVPRLAVIASLGG